MIDRYVRQAVRRAGVEFERARLQLSTSPRALDPNRAVDDLPETPRVLFLCHGNVCRSPMAERYARKCDEADLARFDSAGFVREEGRPSPTAAVDAAAQYDVDLTTHRSSRVTTEALAESDLVFVMDVRNYCRLHREYPDRPVESYFLSAFTRNDAVAIDDPFNRGWRAYRSVYASVTDAVETLVAAIAADSSVPRAV